MREFLVLSFPYIAACDLEMSDALAPESRSALRGGVGVFVVIEAVEEEAEELTMRGER